MNFLDFLFFFFFFFFWALLLSFDNFNTCNSKVLRLPGVIVKYNFLFNEKRVNFFQFKGDI